MNKERDLIKSRKKKTKEEFYRKEEFFKAIIDGMRCGVLSIDINGRVLRINEMAKKILDINETAVVEGGNISALLGMYPDLSRMMLESFHISTLPNREEMEISCKGKRKKIGFSISLVHDEEGRNIGSSLFFKDLTKIEEKEEQQRLKERLAALGHMSASLAHELKNPLGAIEVNISFLKRKLKKDRVSLEIIDGIISDITRLKKTINESLSFVRPLDLNLAISSIDKVIDKAISSVISETTMKNIKIKRDYKEKIDPFLLDNDLITKVLINIFQNSIEAMESKGTLKVELIKIRDGYEHLSQYDHSADHSKGLMDQEYARIQIKDSGRGIPQEIIDKIFYPFFTTKEQGSGLGLSFSKKVVDAHKGMIDVESRIGSGTTFTIQIPMIHQCG